MKTKNQPRLALSDLLRRRKMTLKQFIDEFGITTFEALIIRCDRMGVMHPKESDFKSVLGEKIVSSPTEGVVVLNELNDVNNDTPDDEDSDDAQTLDSMLKPKKRKRQTKQNDE